jgi:hypothetical protein
MPRLLRPPIPLDVKLRVLLRQLGEMWPDAVIRAAREERRLGAAVTEKYTELSQLLRPGEKIVALQLDHDPALENREKLVLLPGGRKARLIIVPEGGEVVRYYPDANDPEHLIYREKHAHHIKTNVRGDGAQFPDRVLIKRERRRQNGKQKKSRPVLSNRAGLKSLKRRIPNRRDPWPPRGSRPLGGQKKRGK